MKNSYSEPTLFPLDRSMKKSWFVAFRYTDPNTGFRKQFQYRGDINKHKTKRERIAEGNSLAAILSDMLAENWNPFTDETEKEPDRKPLYDLLDEMLEVKKSTLRIKSYRTYSDAKKIFQRWMIRKGIKTIMPQQFTHKMARQYADYLLAERKYQGRTYNSMVRFTKMFFKMLLDREIIKENPFAKIERMTQSIGSNHAYTSSEKTAIIDTLKRENIRLYYFINFMYHGFIRRSEIVQLKISDIDYSNRSIVIRSSISKNRKQESIAITQGLWNIIEEMDLKQYPEHYYIFAHYLQPGTKQYKKPDSITEMHKKVLRRLNIPSEKTLYSWKHTGVCDYYEDMKDPYEIMRQLRHHDLKVTMIYLKSLGLRANEKFHNANLSL